MSNTGKPFVNFEPSRLIETDDMKERFFEFLNDQVKSTLARVYNSPGTFDALIAMSSPGNDQFSLAGTSLVTDGEGNILDVAGDFAYCQDVRFENESGISYEVSLTVNEGPMSAASGNTIRSNSRTGSVAYLGRMNYIGELGSPDSVDVVGSDITFSIDSLCEAGVSHEGRHALIWLVDPVSNTSTVGLPIEEIEFVGGENVVTVDSTLLGQASGSTDPADYQIIVLGPTVRRNSTNEGVPGYAIMGIARGSGAGAEPTNFSTTGQALISVSLSEINNAFANFVTTESIDVSGAGPKTTWDSTQQGFVASCSISENIYAFGGVQGSGGGASFSNQAVRYDTVAGTWGSLSNMAASLAGAAACSRANVAYVAGGHNASGAVTTVQRYDQETEAWLADAAPLPEARAYGTLVLSTDGQNLYYVGGSSHTYDATAVVEREIFQYDVDDDSWLTLTNIPAAASIDPAGAPNVVFQDGFIYILGGSTELGSDSDGEASDECFRYDVDNNVWADLSTAIMGQGFFKLGHFGLRWSDDPDPKRRMRLVWKAGLLCSQRFGPPSVW